MKALGVDEGVGEGEEVEVVIRGEVVWRVVLEVGEVIADDISLLALDAGDRSSRGLGGGMIVEDVLSDAEVGGGEALDVGDVEEGVNGRSNGVGIELGGGGGVAEGNGVEIHDWPPSQSEM